MEALPEYTFFETRVLQRAIASGSVRKIKFLISRGCHPNGPCGPDYLRPLMLACYISDEKKRNDVIEALLQVGATPGLTDKHGRSALYYASWLGLEKPLSLLLKSDDSNLTRGDHKEGNTCLHISAICGRLEVLKMLVQKMKRNGVSLNTRNHQGHTALTSAYIHNKMDCFEYLHNEGALPRHHWLDFARIIARRPTINRIIEDSIRSNKEKTLPPIRTTGIVTPQHPSSGIIIAKLLAKTAHKKHNEDIYLRNNRQVPIDADWVDTIVGCRASPVEPLTPIISLSTIVSATTRLKNLRKRCSTRTSTPTLKGNLQQNNEDTTHIQSNKHPSNPQKDIQQ
uniref:Uncharacterized protein n=1 Tax=Amphimedon queenslandica TaxID=400682 RepID=A0A1X7TMI7_AMPQE